MHGNDDTLSAEDMALGYKQMIRVEQAWRDMKSTLDMRPVFHWAPHRIHAHVAITVLSLLLERTAEHACGDTWRNVSDCLRRIQLAQLLSPHGTVWQVTDPPPEAAKCLKSLQIKPPRPFFSSPDSGKPHRHTALRRRAGNALRRASLRGRVTCNCQSQV